MSSIFLYDSLFLYYSSIIYKIFILPNVALANYLSPDVKFKCKIESFDMLLCREFWLTIWGTAIPRNFVVIRMCKIVQFLEEQYRWYWLVTSYFQALGDYFYNQSCPFKKIQLQYRLHIFILFACLNNFWQKKFWYFYRPHGPTDPRPHLKPLLHKAWTMGDDFWQKFFINSSVCIFRPRYRIK